ncbi:MAG TPA: chemotaxis protein, partial [Syntrophomonas sp.]|nr:chemotaxis protein [Syntrophomonas sp.]
MGGSTILRSFHGIDTFRVLGICDVNPAAPGMRLAQELGIPAFSDLKEMLQLPALE